MWAKCVHKGRRELWKLLVFLLCFSCHTQVKSLCPKTDETMMILMWWNRFDHIFEWVGPLCVFHSCYSFETRIFSKILLRTLAVASAYVLLQLVIGKKKKLNFYTCSKRSLFHLKGPRESGWQLFITFVLKDVDLFLFNLLAVFTYFWGGGGGFDSLAPFITYMSLATYSFCLAQGWCPQCTHSKSGLSVQKLNVSQPSECFFGLALCGP